MATTTASAMDVMNHSAMLPGCAQACLQTVAPAQGSCASDDLHCLCTKSLYIDSLACCISNGCDPDDEKKAAETNRQNCAAVNVTIPDFVGCAANASSEIASAIISATVSQSLPAGVTPGPGASTIAAFEAAPAIAVTGQVAQYPGSALLTGSCTTPVYASATLDADSGGGIVEFPWLGCSNQNKDCCPFDPNKGGQLSVCPSDYISTSSACCPFGWSIYTTAIASQTPCFTLPPNPLIPNNATNAPTFTAGLFIMSTTLFALKYNLAPPPGPPTITTVTVAGIAVGGAIVVALFIFGLFYCYRRRHHRRRASNNDPASHEPMSSNDPMSRTQMFSGPASRRSPTLVASPTGSGGMGRPEDRMESPTTTLRPLTLREGNRETMLPEQPMWFPMPPEVQHRKTMGAEQVLESPSELAGDTALTAGEGGVAEEAGGDVERGIRQAFVADALARGGIGVGLREKEGDDEKGMMW